MTGISGRTTIVFLCGIAGVGKTFLVERVHTRVPRIVVARASAIISEARQRMDADALRELPVDEIARSQELLVRGMGDLRTRCSGSLIVLDGHSVIDASTGFYHVDVNVMARLRVQLLIHIEDDVTRVLTRRQSDSSRRRPDRSANELAEYQRRSLAQCELFRDQLDIPLARIRAGDNDALRAVLESLLGP